MVMDDESGDNEDAEVAYVRERDENEAWQYLPLTCAI